MRRLTLPLFIILFYSACIVVDDYPVDTYPPVDPAVSYYADAPISSGRCQGVLDGYRVEGWMTPGQNWFSLYPNGPYDETYLTLSYDDGYGNVAALDAYLADVPSGLMTGYHDLGFGWSDPSPYILEFSADVIGTAGMYLQEGVMIIDYADLDGVVGNIELYFDYGELFCSFEVYNADLY